MEQFEHLNKRLERRYDEKDRQIARGMAEKEHMDAISGAPDGQKTSFWCEECELDFDTNGKKRVSYLGVWPVAWYVGICACGAIAYRRITDKRGDAYYGASASVCRERRMKVYDTIDPSHPMFKILYAKEWRKFEQKRYGRKQ